MTVFPYPIEAGAHVLVTGATGFTGSVVTRKLIEQGATVHAVARSIPKDQGSLPVRWFRGNVYDPAVVSAAMDGVHYVIHLAAAYRKAVTEEEYRQVHVVSTQLLVQAAARQPGFRRFVQVSTVGVHGHIDGAAADETHPFAPGDSYQRTKAEAELWVREHAPVLGVDFTVIRPAAIFGPGDQRLLKVFRMARHRFCILLGAPPHRYHLIHVEDLATVLTQVLTHPAASGETFIVGNSEPTTLEDICRVVAATLGHKSRIVHLPAWPVFLAADLCEAVCKPLRISPPLYRRRVAFFTKDRAFNTTKLRTVLGYVAQYDNQAGIIQTARWYREHGWL